MVTVLLIVVYLIDFIALILKLVEVINVAWVWILFPYWFPILVLVVVFLIANIRERIVIIYLMRFGIGSIFIKINKPL